MDMSNNNDYATGNLLDFAYFKENYKLIATDLSKQTKFSRDFEILGWCPVGPVLPNGEKVPL